MRHEARTTKTSLSIAPIHQSKSHIVCLVIKTRRLVAHLVVVVVVVVLGALVVLVVVRVIHLVAGFLRLLGRLGVVDDLAACAAATLEDVALVDRVEVTVVVIVFCRQQDALVLG